jgi:phosphatidate cytidylyltransferase
MKQLLTRTIFGAIYVLAIVCGILCGKYAVMVLMILLCILAIDEFLTLTTGEESQSSTAVVLRLLDCIGGCSVVVGIWAHLFLPAFLLFGVYLLLRMIAQLYITGTNPIRSVALSMMSQLYITMPIAAMAVMANFSKWFLLSMFVLVWVNDTFAYLTGSMLGRHKLWERISPKKSWEGFIGGAVFCIAAAALIGYYAPTNMIPFDAREMAGAGLIVALAGTLGDLFESLIKRTIGVKDSGSLIPGHGGILDRIDSILFVIPSTLFYMFLLMYYVFI